jgi:DNA-binding response OmpR family regulator
MPIDTKPFLEEAQASTKTILLVEDDPSIRSFLVEAITQETPYRVMVASDGNAALNVVQHFAPRLFVLDYGCRV